MGQTSILSLPDELLGRIVDYALPQDASSVDCLGRVAADPTPLLYTNRKFHCLTREVYYQKRPLQLLISATTSPCSHKSGRSQAKSTELETSTPARTGHGQHHKVPWPFFKKVNIHLYPDVSYLDLQTSIPDVIQHMRQLEDHLYDILSPYNEHRFSKRNQLTLTFHESCPFHQTTLSMPRNATTLPYWSLGSVGRTLGQFRRVFPKRDTFRKWYLSSVTLPSMAILTHSDNEIATNASIAEEMISTGLLDSTSMPFNHKHSLGFWNAELESIFSDKPRYITRGVVNPATKTWNPLPVILRASFPPLTQSYTSTRSLLLRSPRSRKGALFHAECRVLYDTLCTIYPELTSVAWAPHVVQPLGLTLMHQRLLAYGKWVRHVLMYMDILERETEQMIGLYESFREWEDVKADAKMETRRRIREVVPNARFEEESVGTVNRWATVVGKWMPWVAMGWPLSRIFGSLGGAV